MQNKVDYLRTLLLLLADNANKSLNLFTNIYKVFIFFLTPIPTRKETVANLQGSFFKDDENPKDEDPETNEKNGRLYDKAGKMRKMKYEQV